ncbi:hypothetical protein G647_02234 [Cladophialophora carrionii CBS 160.54]|uniref:MARVEL domain-containing protein n=1 Tax=Cladophialophora carrionii CBS 160.54 TaxID=1279043 RepID=V9DFN0_9EURO|nr:uncharacterized protein G647_02234 [Cladophialophora carrionii CBS 160.54]ETI25461.1 hypothetical protein G647_02234 [Cladophialophora carrionii CBS 160.54]
MISINLSWKDAPTSRIVHLIQVFLQFLAAIIVIGLNASDIADDPTNTGISVLAIVIATLSTVTTILFALDIFYPIPSRLWLLWVLFWEWVLAFSWVGVVAAFGDRYFQNHTTRFHVAAGFNVVNLILWLLGSVYGTILMCCRKKLGGKRPPDDVELK